LEDSYDAVEARQNGEHEDKPEAVRVADINEDELVLLKSQLQRNVEVLNHDRQPEGKVKKQI
jgi:hypothetical protein